jgi:hypothetical protein
MPASERDAMIRVLVGKEYRVELRRLAALGVEGPATEEEE